MVVVNTTAEFRTWLAGLNHREQVSVLQTVKLLQAAGVALGAPWSSALEGTALPLRELRPQRGASPLRIVYAFDPRKEALLLLGGDKAADRRFYRRARTRAERRWRERLAALRKNEP
jgi:hypothetical protein